ncbi:carboxylating nicotinate-nucleotide diphosphorylase [Bacillus sp. B1-b2]|uniref:carboxylating nicotinate-nucleotide diphosphorylase n=1 Tax=Bacillus sp. B1-b2 TaxID=2653201 RepID=UPI001262689A|nr:carboxylating nicotinate-nucleotide diphosphorylase [Bacillus sp. B1-b2]KAB7671987.1 carboxylating nicotinate-nucleotide diphosphorylase [Bacillus sp. B1-b2]
MNQLVLRNLMELLLNEDIGVKDLTTEAIFSKNQMGEITFIAEDSGVFCGEEIIKTGYFVLNPSLSINLHVHDGDLIEKGQELATVKGNIRDLLSGQRVILQLVQRMSGIATKTREAVDQLNSGYTKICDAGETSPGLRIMEQYAVTIGGGHNHRFGLSDGVVITKAHITLAGSIANAVQSVKKNVGHMVKVEVEADTKEQMLEALAAGSDVIKLMNRNPEELVEWIVHVPETVTTEASGHISIEDIASYRNSGVDYISLKGLTQAKPIRIFLQVRSIK